MQDWIGAFAARAATIDERLSSHYVPQPSLKADAELAAARLASWCQSAASGDWALFAKRLRRDGLSMEAIMPRLGRVALAGNARPPGWAEDAAWILAALPKNPGADYAAALLRHDKPEPFEDLFLGIVFAAEQQRDQALTQRVLSRVQPAALRSMAQDLLKTVTGLCAMALYEHFARCRQEWSQGAPLKPQQRQHYDRFIREMRAGGLLRLFDHKPVLLRLLASVIRQWIEAGAEFLMRLDQDWALINDGLLPLAPAGPVMAITSGLSDPHNFGRSVLVLRFAAGQAVVYKPKDMRVDARWADLIAWLNQRQPPIGLAAARVIERDGYGWSEFIAHADCVDQEAANRFFRRAGALLALWHLMAATDMHEENVIAAGEYPVGIDLEMILQANDPAMDSQVPALRMTERLDRRFKESVSQTGLLPSFMKAPDTAVLASGGLSDNDVGKPQRQEWAGLNSDVMQPAPPKYEAADKTNLPRLNGATIRLTDYLVPFREGCQEYLAFLLGLKDQLLADKGPIAAFEGCLIRHVIKPTRFYFLLLDRVRNHRDMQDGAIWSAHLDFGARLADWDKEQETLWPLALAERRALADLNIPFFVHAADGERLQDGVGLVAASGMTPGLHIARERISRLDQAAIAWQLDVIRLCTMGSEAFDLVVGAGKHPPRKFIPSAGDPLSPDVAFSAADDIAQQIKAAAARDEYSAAWIGLDPLADGGGWEPLVLGTDLYGGAPGVALFLAAHGRIRNAAQSAELALAGLAPARHHIHSSGAARFARKMGIGGASGIGSMAYAFGVVAELLDDPGLMRDALHAARLLTDDVIRGDNIFDVVGGAAGCILALLALHRRTGEAFLIERAVACGDHMLRRRMPQADGKGLWVHLSRRPLTGFSHGAAGYAYALSALAKASGAERFANAARDCVEYERRWYSPERMNWPDLRKSSERPGWAAQWCHGAGGVGLGRLGMYRFANGVQDPQLITEINDAISTTLRYWPARFDSVCCGNLGNIELLAEAARLGIGGEAIRDLASIQMRGLIEAAGKAGEFAWFIGGDAENLGFFQGMAGAGYTLLRQAAPGQLPNILILE